MPDYQKGKIYRIWDNGFNKCYIGSTCEDLNRRMAGHRIKYRRYLNGENENFTVFNLFDEYGVENCKIELLENYPCNSRAELHAKEGQHQRENDCVNKLIAGRTDKQYYEDNKEAISRNNKLYVENHREETKAYKQKWYKENKEYKAKQSREWYELNREEIIEQKKQYYKDHKKQIQKQKRKDYESKRELILTKLKQPWICECGITTTVGNKSRHIKSLKHQHYINQMNQQEPSNSS